MQWERPLSCCAKALSYSAKPSYKSIKKILDSTTVISDNITHLSATGEEVAASSTEGLRMADTTVESMAKCKKVLENIYMLADDLKNSVEESEEVLGQKYDFQEQ